MPACGAQSSQQRRESSPRIRRSRTAGACSVSGFDGTPLLCNRKSDAVQNITALQRRAGANAGAAAASAGAAQALLMYSHNAEAAHVPKNRGSSARFHASYSTARCGGSGPSVLIWYNTTPMMPSK